jgi:pimeloyl-ACP methyl ester carboxylesterase
MIHTILVPGLLCSTRLWTGVLPYVWDHGPLTIADTRRDATLEGMADRLLAGAPERFALVGLSMGGYLALEVMRRAPERVAALGLVSTSARADTERQTATRHEQMAMTRDGRFDELVQGMFPTLVAADARDDEELRAAWRAMARDVGPYVFLHQLEAIIARPDSRPLLPGIACPAAVVHGAGDQLLDVENGEEMAAAIPGAQRAIIPGCGHLSALERPEDVGAALGLLLQRART